MNYIVDPSWVYWLNVRSGIRTFVLCIPLIIFVVGAIIVYHYICKIPKKPKPTWQLTNEYDEDSEEAKKADKAILIYCILLAITTIISIVVAIFVPSKETLIEMKAASIITKENLNISIDVIKQLIDYAKY